VGRKLDARRLSAAVGRGCCLLAPEQVYEGNPFPPGTHTVKVRKDFPRLRPTVLTLLLGGERRVGFASWG